MPGGQAVIFELAGVRYGIDILQVQEIIRMVEITPVAETDVDLVFLKGIVKKKDQLWLLLNMSGVSSKAGVYSWASGRQAGDGLFPPIDARRLMPIYMH